MVATYFRKDFCRNLSDSLLPYSSSSESLSEAYTGSYFLEIELIIKLCFCELYELYRMVSNPWKELGVDKISLGWGDDESQVRQSLSCAVEKLPSTTPDPIFL